MQRSDHIGKIIILLLVLVIVAQVYFFDEAFELVLWWRVWTVASKLTGNLPELTWSRTFTAVAPASLYGKEGIFETGFVTRVREEKGVPCPMLFRTPLGDFWGRRKDEPMFEFLLVEQLVYRLYDHDTASVGPRDIVLDVGSHLGTFTRFALMRGARKVVGFEPDPGSISCFKRTFAEELQDGKVVLVEAAAWESPGTLQFEVHDLWSAHSNISKEGALEVKAVTIDAEVANLGLASVDFIKMDIEGAERHALRGALQTLQEFGPKMTISIYHREDDPEVIPEIVLGAQPAYRMVSSRGHWGGILYVSLPK